MADAPAPSQPAAPPSPAPSSDAASTAPPTSAEPRLTGRAALAVFQEMEPEVSPGPKATPAPAVAAPSAPGTTGSTAASPPAAASPSAPADGSQSPPSTASPSNEPARPAAEQTPQQRAAFKALAEGQAELRRERQAFESLKGEAQAIVEWFKAVQADPTKLAEKLGADIFERGARAAAGAPPKPVDPNEQIAALNKRLDDEAKQRQQEAIQAQVAQSHQVVRGMLEKAGDGFDAVLSLNRQGEVFDAFSLYLRDQGVQVQNGRYFSRDGTPLADNFETTLVVELGKRVNAEIVQELGGLVEKVPSLRSRFAPAPAAAAAPAAPATPAAPPKDPAPPAREAPAPATLTSKHGNDAAPSVSNGRRKTIAEVDDEIAARFWG
jgi:hypothetical protein